MRGVRQSSEPRRPLRRYVDLIDAVAARVEPDTRDLQPWVANYAEQHRVRLAFDLQVIEQRLTPPAKLLECGAVPLLATGALAELSYDVRAVDVAPQRFSTTIAALDLDVTRCDIESEPLPFEDESFDAVVFNELFEHLRINPIVTMREVRRVLSAGGTLFLSTPNLRSLRGIRNIVFRHQASASSGGVYRQYEKLETLGHMGHVREYTAREVGDFLTRIGFAVEEVIYRGGHGRGLVGVAERLLPSMRPFFSLVAIKDGAAG